MTFQEQLNLYIEELSCSGRELAQNSGISETILSRYRKGERIPCADSDYLKKLAAVKSSSSIRCICRLQIRLLCRHLIVGSLLWKIMKDIWIWSGRWRLRAM